MTGWQAPHGPPGIILMEVRDALRTQAAEAVEVGVEAAVASDSRRQDLSARSADLARSMDRLALTCVDEQCLAGDTVSEVRTQEDDRVRDISVGRDATQRE